MAETRAGFFDRTWSRAPLIARLTIAGLIATIVLALAFGLGISAIQQREAQRSEEQRSLREARAVARALDLSFFGEGRKPGDPLAAETAPLWQKQLDTLRGLLDLEGLAIVTQDGAVFVRSVRATATDWENHLTAPTQPALARLRSGELKDVQSVSLQNLKGLEAIVVNNEVSLKDEASLSAAEEAAVRLAQGSPFRYVALLRNMKPVEEHESMLMLLSIAEALVTAALLLLGGLLFVRKEVASPVMQISSIVAELARTGELAVARSQLLKVWGKVTQDEGDKNELRQLVCGFDALLASLERLAAQANAIARDDLWNEAFDKEGETRGDLAVAFRKMVSNLRELSIRVGRIARGDLSVGASAPGSKEGSLGSAFREMTEKLKLLLDELASAGSKIDRSARGLQESSRDQASTATQQAAAVTETMATMEELAASSGHIADTAKHVVQLADETLLSAKNGNTAVTDVGTGMDEIVQASRQGAHRLLDLGEKSRSIGKVAELITGIAEQSKILALNAAIEAARAGEAGRGFGVVAEEVRNLADHVVESTREIEGLIGQIQSEISAAVLASEEEVKRAEKGRELATRATSSLQAITDTASRTTDAARQIELATNQQRSASGQVATAVREVASSSEEVATGAKRVTVSANELAALAHDLQAVINQFEVSDDAGGGGKRVHSASSSGSRPSMRGSGNPPGTLSGSSERAALTLDSEALRRG